MQQTITMTITLEECRAKQEKNTTINECDIDVLFIIIECDLDRQFGLILYCSSSDTQHYCHVCQKSTALCSIVLLPHAHTYGFATDKKIARVRVSDRARV